MRSRPWLLAALIATAGSMTGCFLGFGDYKVAQGATGSGGAGGTGGASSASSVGGAGTSSSQGTGGGAGAGGGGSTCGPGSTAEMKDDFNDNMTSSQWNAYTNKPAHATVQEVGQAVRLDHDGTLDAAAAYYWQDTPRSLLGCAIFVELKQAPDPTALFTTYFRLVDDSNLQNRIELHLKQDRLYFRSIVNGVNSGIINLNFDPISHRWWRLRESKGHVYFDTAPDGKAWKTQASMPTPAVASAVRADLSVYADVDAAPGGTAIFDNLNISPP